MNRNPYIGVTGAITVDEIISIGREFLEAGYSKNDSYHLPMIGILVSQKTLNGEQTSNRRYPQFPKVKELLSEADLYGLPAIHYNSREKETLADQIERIFEGVYPKKCNTIQLNISWPEIKQLEKARENLPSLQYILQLSQDMTKVKEIVEKTREYEKLADYILIDPSGGKGKEFEIEQSLELFRELEEFLPQSTIGFAGGFTGINVFGRVKNLSERLRHNNFCIDAEGGLRDKISEEYGDDLLNILKVKDYIQEASKILI